ncbi:hypothetical protein [Actinomycetospora atypica]|uniref:DUF4149 domain-containing protein n=1 Tax=Actinomycetospora atypica TaxID=1290095 RepID=A0ABV9YVV7_9PSEU
MRAVVRACLAVPAVTQLLVGTWALLAPASFFADFPGGGRAWVASLPPYNEHLVRDVGALGLALGVVLVAALVRPTRGTVTLAAGAFLVHTVPHLVFHQHHLEGMGAPDAVAQQGGFVAQVLLTVLAVVVTHRRAYPTERGPGQDRRSGRSQDDAVAARP